MASYPAMLHEPLRWIGTQFSSGLEFADKRHVRHNDHSWSDPAYQPQHHCRKCLAATAPRLGEEMKVDGFTG